MKLRKAQRAQVLILALVVIGVAVLSQMLRRTPEVQDAPVVHDPRLDAVRACQENLRQIGTAMEMYATHASGKYATSIDALVPEYLPSIPICPKAGQDTYSPGFRMGPDAPGNSRKLQDFYAVCCSGDHHQDVGLSFDSPSYDAAFGALPKLPFVGTKREALAKCEQNLKSICTAMEMYSIDYRGAYPNSLGQLVPDYLAEIPPCPIAEVDTYSKSLELGASSPHNPEKFGAFYYFECSGGHHQGVTKTGAEPSFDSVRGLNGSS